MTINGTPGNDTLNGGPDNDVLYGLDGDDRLYGNEGNDTLYGGAGGDYMFGGPGNDSMAAGAGYDYLYGGAGDDTLDGGADSDSVFYNDATGSITANLALGTATGVGIGRDTLIGVENIYGSQYADILIGDLGRNYLSGSGGNDTLTGGAGSDDFDVWNGAADTSVDTITDFTAGLGADRLSILPWGWTNYTNGDNLFVSGHARLTQSGANTLFEVDPDGSVGAAGFRTVAILNNVITSHLVAYNLDGFDPNAIGGTAADDSLTGSTGNDQIYGLAGNDTVNGLAGEDSLYGGSGNDVLDGGDSSDQLYGNAGNDSMAGGNSNDQLYGNEGDDSIAGGAGSDFLYGGAGDDTLDGGAGSDSVYYYDATGPITVNLALGTATGAGIGSDTLISIEEVIGSQYADILTGDAGSNSLQGSSGNDTLSGGAGSDNFGVWNGDSADTSVVTITDFTAGAGGDQLSIPTWWFTNYTNGDNPFASGHARLTQSGTRTLFEVDQDGSVGASVFRTVGILNNVTKSNLVAFNLNGFEPNVIRGTAAADSLTGGAGNDQIYGLDGNDTVNGLAGDDRLYGGSGNDVLNGGDGNDQLYGNEGNDSIAGGAGYDTLTGGAGDDTLDGGADSDSVSYSEATGPVTVNLALGTATGAGTGSDTLISVERVIGSQYADSLTGGAGSDSLSGWLGNDVLNGGDGNDYLYGEGGNDNLTGGAGSDYFSVWNGATDIAVDSITDFTAGPGGDRISVPTWALTNYTAGDNPLVSGHVRLTKAGANTLLEVDSDGFTGVATFRTVAILNNVTKSNLVAENLNGFDPNAIGGTPGPDSLSGGMGNDEIYGLAGNDTVNGLAGHDRLYGGADNDVLNGGDGNDQLYGNEGNDSISGGAGYDTLTGGAGDDTLSGGAGADSFDVWNGATDTAVDTITDFTVGTGGDRISVPTWAMTTYTAGGSPFVTGHIRLTQSGVNTLLEVDSDGSGGAAVFRTVAILNDVTKSNLVADNLGGFDPNAIGGSAAADSLSGGAGNDQIYGLNGNDTLNGGAGSDELNGGLGNDVLSGGDGDDYLIGFFGDDTLTGGEGADHFDLSILNPFGDASVDTITDFTAGPGGDWISVVFTEELGQNSGESPFVSDFRLTQSGGNTLLEVDNDGSDGAGGFRTVAILNNVIRGNLVAENLDGYDPNPIIGTPGANSLTGGTGKDEIYGLAGNDTLNGLAGDDRLNGGLGNDTLNGGAGADNLIGGAGNDTLDGGAITDWIGGTDYNRASYGLSTAGVTVNLGAGAGIGNGSANDGLGGTDTLININQIYGSHYADSITGSSGSAVFEQIEGGFGDDTLNGGVIADTLNQKDNNCVSYRDAFDAVYVDLAAGTADGAAGNDILLNFSQVRGSAYHDTLYGSDSTLTERFEGLAGNDEINGRGGFDVVAYDNSRTAVTVNLFSGTASDGFGGTDALINIEGICGSVYNDVLTGGLAANGISVSDGLSETFIGNAGNDTIDGGQGYDRVDYTTSPIGVNVTLNDTLDGSANDGFGGTDTLRHIEGVVGSAYNDTLTGSDSATFESFEGRAGNDQINGKGGIDRIDYYSSTAGATVNLATGTASDGYGGTDTLANIENVQGSRDFNDSLTGSTANNKLEGLGGNDTLDGGAGSDTLAGGDGSDTYVVRDSGDVVSETNAVLATGGSDTVYSTLAAYTLTNNVENGRILSTTAANLTGNTLNNVLYAGAGNNVLDGGSGTDTVSYVYGLAGTSGVTVSLAVSTAQATGGSGSDTLTSIENLIGSAYADKLTGNAGANSLAGGAGTDTLDGGAGSDTLAGGDGSDTYVVRDSGDVVSETNAVLASGGSDTVYSYLSTYTLTANVENGRILATGAANLTGNTLNNVLYAGAGSNVLNGGTGIDTVSYAYGLAGTSGVTVSLAVSTAQATGGSGSDTLASIENLIGSAYADQLTGNADANSLGGGAGNDTLDGGAGSDTLVGGDGSDTYVVRDGGDVVSETNAVLATGGTDTVSSTLAAYTLTANVENGRILATGAANLSGNTLNNVLYAGAGNNALNGGSGTDTVSYAYGLAGTSGVTVSLAVSTAQATGGSGSDTLTSIENLIGSAYADKLTGNTGANSLAGGAGSDTLDGGAGSDTLAGGDGSDTYVVRDGGDVVSETNAVLATGGTDTVYSTLATYTLTANVENGRILATMAANLNGNTLNNVLYAGAGNNVLDGGTGIDTVSYAYGLAGTTGVTASLAVSTAQATGGSGSDTLTSIENLIGSGLNDNLTGNSAANVLTGGLGKDLLIGGAGGDIFDFNALSEMGLTSATWDVINDFAPGLDRIDVSTIDANAGLAGDQAFSAPVVGGTFSGVFASPGDLYFDTVAHVLYGNTDADTAAEFAIQLVGVTTLTTVDLFL